MKGSRVLMSAIGGITVVSLLVAGIYWHQRRQLEAEWRHLEQQEGIELATDRQKLVMGIPIEVSPERAENIRRRNELRKDFMPYSGPHIPFTNIGQ